MPEETDHSEELQFEHAETGDDAGEPLVCAHSGETISGEYYLANGSTISARSKAELEGAFGDSSGGGSRMMRAVLFGAVAAAAGSAIYFAVSYFTGYEVGLISILVGFMVGKAVAFGTGGRGGLKYQLIAVAFTYLSIVSSYVPTIIMELAAEPTTTEASAAATGEAPGSAETSAEASAEASMEASSANTGTVAADDEAIGLVGVLTLLALLLALPFLAGFENIIGIFIIGIGLWEAWKLNARSEIVFEGPFQTGAA